MADHGRRELLLCPKCGSGDMEIHESREMFKNPYPKQQPLYGATGKIRVKCGECGTVVWPEKVEKPKAEKGKKE